MGGVCKKSLAGGDPSIRNPADHEMDKARSSPSAAGFSTSGFNMAFMEAETPFSTRR
jgi:hypothetical protein